MAFKDTYIGKAWEAVANRSEQKEYEVAVTKMVNAIKHQRTLYRKEIREWKMAKIAAQNPMEPRRKLLIDLYDDIMDDAFIFGRSETRKLRISNKEGVIINANGEIDEEKSSFFKTSWFNQFIKYDVESVYYGYSLIYPKKLDENGRIKEIDIVWRDHVVPETEEILIHPYDKNGEKFTEGPAKNWFIWINHNKFLGLLDKAAPLYIFKKHSWQNWDEFEERFSIPIRIAKYAGTDKRVKAEIDKWLKDLGSSSYARFPEGVDIEIKESQNRDSYNVFNEKRKACNEELATLFDGHFETAKDTGNLSKAEAIFSGTQDLITMDDEKRAEYDVNDILIPMMIRMGYPLSETDTFEWNENIQSTPKERLEIFEGVKRLGYAVKQKQIETELDVELEVIVSDEEPPPINDPEADPKNANFKKPHNSKGCGAHSTEYRHLNTYPVAKLNNEEDELLERIFNNPDEIDWDYNAFMRSHGSLIESLRKGYGNTSFDFDSEDHLTMRHFMANIHRFGKDKSQRMVLELNRLLKDPALDTKAKFKEAARRLIPNYREAWLDTEVDQAYAVSQMAARHQEMMEDIDDAPYWKYVTVGDDRVRLSHTALDGKVFAKSDSEAWRFLPPNGFKCRCDAEDVLESYDGSISTFSDGVNADIDGFNQMQKSGHDVNWGDEKQIFTAAQSYLAGLSETPIDVGGFGFKMFGLKAFKNISSKIGLRKKAIDFDSLKDTSGMAKFEDKLKLPVWLPEAIYNEAPDSIKNSISIILGQADEIYWLDAGDGFVYKYLKYFKDKTVMVSAFFNKNSPTTITFFDTIEDVDIERTGLLIYATNKTKA